MKNKEEKEFTASDMIRFANWHSEGEITDEHLQFYRDHLKQIEDEEYQTYLALKAKYETNTNIKRRKSTLLIE